MTKHVEIVNVKGFVLRGYLELPENAKRIVCMFHGFTGNKTEHNGHYRNLARLLAKEGILHRAFCRPLRPARCGTPASSGAGECCR